MEKSNFSLDAKKITQSLSIRVYLEVKKAILKGEFQPGEYLHEDYLAKETGASRTPIREALLHLQRDRLIEIIPRKGARVCQLGQKKLHDLVEMRILFESVFFDRQECPSEVLAELLNTRNEMARLSAEMDKRESRSEEWLEIRQEYSRQGFRFHRYLVEVMDNESLLEAYDILMGRIQLHFNQAMVRNVMFFNSCAQDHENILNAIQDNRMGTAKSLHAEHLRKMSNYSLFMNPYQKKDLTLKSENEIN